VGLIGYFPGGGGWLTTLYWMIVEARMASSFATPQTFAAVKRIALETSESSTASRGAARRTTVDDGPAALVPRLVEKRQDPLVVDASRWIAGHAVDRRR
jgi:hypothetical protein